MEKTVLKNNPSLKPRLAKIGAEDSYPRAAVAAARETDKDKSTFPPTFEQTGWSWEQVLDNEFYPD